MHIHSPQGLRAAQETQVYGLEGTFEDSGTLLRDSISLLVNESPTTVASTRVCVHTLTQFVRDLTVPHWLAAFVISGHLCHCLELPILGILLWLHTHRVSI